MSQNSINKSSPNPQLRLLALIGLFLVANLVVPFLIWDSNDELVALSAAGLVSEPVLLAIWFVFSTGDALRRLARLVLIFLCGWFTWMVGVRMVEGRLIPWEVGVFFALVGILLMGLLTGAGFAYRLSTGKVLFHRNQLQPHRGRVVQFSIKQILGWTTVVALALMVSRFLFVTNGRDASFWREVPSLIGVGLVFFVLIVIVTVACLELALGQGSRIKSFGVLVLAIPVAPVLATIGLVFAFGTASRADLTEAFGAIFLFFLGLSLTTTFALTWVRWIGFRLVRTADTSPNATERGSA